MKNLIEWLNQQPDPPEAFDGTAADLKQLVKLARTDFDGLVHALLYQFKYGFIRGIEYQKQQDQNSK